MLSPFRRTRAAATLIGAALALTFVAPGSAAAQDMRTPDVLDGAQRSPSDEAGTTTFDDVRTPDARESRQDATPSQDQRSPDARDVPGPAPESQPVAEAPSAPGGFDLVSAAIGAAAGAGLLLVLFGAVATGGHAGRRRHRAARA